MKINQNGFNSTKKLHMYFFFYNPSVHVKFQHSIIRIPSTSWIVITGTCNL